ncbi:methionine--tRNA ligase [Candidatus Sumerlaeota bacterium]|nr:methionine--tRNA ligase [Candidatus Sumerlaeota bacterium]
MTKRAYFTTPIYYVNGSPHIGHAYTSVLVDMLSRYHKLLGYETWFLTGTDEHGDKVMRSAEKQGMTTTAFVDQISGEFRALLPQLHIANDDFIRTTEERHKKVVRQVMQNLYDKGEIYSAQYGGRYCFGCERFYTDKELVDGKCPDHDTEPEWIEETNYYFRMSNYQDWLISHIKGHPDFIRPEKFRNKALSFLEAEPLKDLSISRPASRLSWGIPLPFDEKHVTYVWFDALLNYCSALGYPDGELFQNFWPEAQHITAKDILIPHGIYWPCMLKAAGIPLYNHLNVHGYWQVDAAKMSKSRGTVINPLDLVQKYGVDAFRYYLAREMRLGNDADFSEVALVNCINSELNDDLGNFVKRITGMVAKYCDGIVPAPNGPAPDQELLDGLERKIMDALQRCAQEIDLHPVVESLIEVVRSMNKYITDQAPWTKYKNGDTATVNGLMYASARMIGLLAQALQPVMPEKSLEMLALIGIPERPVEIDPDLVKPGGKVNSERALFQKYEAPALEDAEPAAEVRPEITPFRDEIEFDDFMKLDLRTATVKTAERVPKSDKLLRMDMDDGTPEGRQIVAGIAKHYTPEEMVGRQVVIVANLKPRKLMGLLSQGMVLCAHGEGGAIRLLTPEAVVMNGGSVS